MNILGAEAEKQLLTEYGSCDCRNLYVLFDANFIFPAGKVTILAKIIWNVVKFGTIESTNNKVTFNILFLQSRNV